MLMGHCQILSVLQLKEAMLLRWAMDGAEPVCVRVAIYDASGLKAQRCPGERGPSRVWIYLAFPF